MGRRAREQNTKGRSAVCVGVKCGIAFRVTTHRRVGPCPRRRRDLLKQIGSRTSHLLISVPPDDQGSPPSRPIVCDPGPGVIQKAKQRRKRCKSDDARRDVPSSPAVLCPGAVKRTTVPSYKSSITAVIFALDSQFLERTSFRLDTARPFHGHNAALRDIPSPTALLGRLSSPASLVAVGCAALRRSTHARQSLQQTAVSQIVCDQRAARRIKSTLCASVSPTGMAGHSPYRIACH